MGIRCLNRLWVKNTALLVLLASPAAGQTIDTFNYWLTGYTNVCTAAVRNNTASFTRTIPGNKSCNVPGRGLLPMYVTIKGTWAEEWYGLDNNNLAIISERHPNLCGGTTYGFRIWRQLNNTVGLDAILKTFSGYNTWFHPAHDLDCGVGCNQFSTSVFLGAGDQVEQGFLGTLWNYLYDCRTGAACTGGPTYPVDVMFKADTWGGGTVKEEYWYGRWTDPQTGQQKGLGLVKYISYTKVGGNWVPQTTTENRYVVSCSIAATCPYC